MKCGKAGLPRLTINCTAMTARISPGQLRAAVGFPIWATIILDFKHNWIVKRHVDPEELARDLGVLKDYEQLLGSWSYLNT